MAQAVTMNIEHHAFAIAKAVRVTATPEAVLDAIMSLVVDVCREERASWHHEREQLRNEVIAARLHASEQPQPVVLNAREILRVVSGDADD